MTSNASKRQLLPETNIVFLRAAAGADFTNPRDLYSVLTHPCNLLFAMSGNSQQPVALPPLQAVSMNKNVVEGQLSSGSLPNLSSHHGYDDLEPNSHRSPGKTTADDSKGAILCPVSSRIVNDGVDNAAQPAAAKERVQVMTFGSDLLLPPIDRGTGYGVINFPSTRFKVMSRSKRIAFPNALPLKSGYGHSRKGKKKKSWLTPIKKGTPNDSEVESTILKGQEMAATLHVNSLSNQTQVTSPQEMLLKVKRPATPTYEDYPEAYWELRSPTIQHPSDLKEDMIDRERYRLQQTSALQLRAFQYESVVSKLDSVRKWQQQIQDARSSPRREANTTVAPANLNSRSDHQGKTDHEDPLALVPPLAVAAISLTGYGLSNQKKFSPGNDPSSRNAAIRDASLLPAAAEHSIMEMQKSPRTEHSPTATKAAATTALAAPKQEPVTDTSTDAGVKIMKASVVNLHIEAARRSPSHVPINSVMRAETTFYDRDSHRHQHVSSVEGLPQPDGHHALNTVTSIGDGLPSLDETRSSYLNVQTSSKPALLLSPAHTSDLERDGQCRTVYSSQSNIGRRKVLKKFNRLQVFGERSASSQQQEDDKGDTLLATPPNSKTPYLPQCRPPSYRLDLKNYPPHLRGCLEGIPGGNAAPASVRVVSLSHTPHEPVTFQFQSGEVIVSRQGSQRAS